MYMISAILMTCYLFWQSKKEGFWVVYVWDNTIIGEDSSVLVGWWPN